MLISFNDSVREHDLKSKATSDIKIQQVLSSLSLNDVGTYLRDGPFASDIGVVNLHPSKGTHWVCYINENCFDGYACAPLKKLSNFIIKRNGHCLYSEYRIQKNDSLCASYCLYIIYLTKVIGIDIKPSFMDLYYQRYLDYQKSIHTII